MRVVKGRKPNSSDANPPRLFITYDGDFDIEGAHERDHPSDYQKIRLSVWLRSVTQADEREAEKIGKRPNFTIYWGRSASSNFFSKIRRPNRGPLKKIRNWPFSRAIRPV